MNHKSIAVAVLSASSIIAVAAPASASPLDSLLGSSGSASGFGSSSGGLTSLFDAGSSALGSSSSKPEHYGKLGRDNAPNGVKSINVWAYAPKAKPISANVYPKNSQLGVKWNSTIDAGPVVDGNECTMSIRITGPKIPAKAALFKTRDCTSVHTYMLRAAGGYSITVTDGISGASNSITFDVR
ncbi:hypothetical protein AAFP35_13230 [Gordonia sp. CPCC 206044]|uniref:hypothetical protein n=1 Tax=Gordonia sp. CPCC 206044 TaxID=3140793 RepID=UPI003AF33E9D